MPTTRASDRAVTGVLVTLAGLGLVLCGVLVIMVGHVTAPGAALAVGGAIMATIGAAIRRRARRADAGRTAR